MLANGLGLLGVTRPGADVAMRAHPAGPLHADVTAPPHPLGPPPADLGRLDPAIWPIGTDRVGGVLQLGGRDVARPRRPRTAPRPTSSTRTTSGPAAAAYRAAFGSDADVYYAGKAFLCTTVARWIAEEGLALDVCTGGELAVALAAGVPGRADRVARQQQVDAPSSSAALDAGVGRIVVDSFDEIDRLAHAADAAGVRPRVLVRVTVGVEAHTHEFIATAHEDQKFGFSLRQRRRARGGRAGSLRCRRSSWSACTPTSARRSSTPPASRSPRTGWSACSATIRDAHGVELPELNLGGGLGIAYVPATTRPTSPRSPSGCATIVERECAAPSLAGATARGRAGPGDRRPGRRHPLRGRHVKDVDRHPRPTSPSTAG